ncbi:hypothetical protein QVD17_29799 [Tagetes erecta]|uniref:Piwi domain-containing protein n=1 Tax=Tagetes erecta TaxID=13708 RepID=A0AAD8NMQ3_TARER|nr:hypothetical protein QVD17_29799 [Tagetes erecta]
MTESTNRTIVFGARVEHPQGEDSTSSTAAVHCSLLKSYSALNGNVEPERIIFYKYENSLILQSLACSSIREGYQPLLTFVVVQKNHRLHSCFFPETHDGQRTNTSTGNILPGTVVDTKICHPTEFDFYICSHNGKEGTSCPAHYHVLHDEKKFTADGLQKLTYGLCYTYARRKESVSMVPAIYYARLAACRARVYMEEGDGRQGYRGNREIVENWVRLFSTPYFAVSVGVSTAKEKVAGASGDLRKALTICRLRSITRLSRSLLMKKKREKG